MSEEDTGEKIEYLFHKGYNCEDIVGLLRLEYGIQISKTTLERRLKDMNLGAKK